MNFFIKMFTSHSGLSSKRVCGFMGWIVCLLVCFWCTAHNVAAPEVIDMLFICSTTLLGADTVTSIWKKDINKSAKDKTNDAV